MPINREEYDNPEVNNASNPSSYGHHHGPVQNPNIDWDPDCENITTETNASAPNPGAVVSKVNGGICHIAVNGNEMCGFQSGNAPAYWRHVRTMHPGAVQNPSRRNVRQPEFSAGENTLKLWVRSKGWRYARFVQEPGRGPVGGLLDQYASEMETLAQEDRTFAKAYGTRFHRSRVNENTPGSNKRKRGPTPPESPPSSPTIGTHAKHQQRKVSQVRRSTRSHATETSEVNE